MIGQMVPSPFHGIFSAFNQEHGSLESDASFGQGGFAQQPMQSQQLPQPQMMQPPVQQPARQQTGQIAVDIYEQDGYYIIRAPIAGVRMSDLDIEVDEKVLTIRGARQLSDTVPDNQYYLQECFWGEFSRSITLPFSINPQKVRATFSKDCILKILIPKEEKVKIVRISEGM